MKFLETKLPDETKIIWRFNGKAAYACLDRIVRVMEPEALPASMPVAAEVSVRYAPYTPGVPAGWSRESLIRCTPEIATRWVSECEIEIQLHHTEPDELQKLLSRIIWYGFLPRMLQRKLIIAHGALLAKADRGVILCGPSGAGKSTSAGRVPPPWRALSDDAVLISRIGESYYAQPLPTWSQLVTGKTRPVHISEAVHLSGIYCLDHSQREKINELPGAERLQILFRQFYDLSHMWRAGRNNSLWRSMNEAVIDFAVEAVRKVPVGELECSLHGEFWKELEKVL